MVLLVETYWFDNFKYIPEIKPLNMMFSVHHCNYDDTNFGFKMTLRELGNIRSQDKIEWFVGQLFLFLFRLENLKMYHLWNQDAGKFQDYKVSNTNTFELTGCIVVLCSPKNIYLCRPQDYDNCAEKLAAFINEKEQDETGKFKSRYTVTLTVLMSPNLKQKEKIMSFLKVVEGFGLVAGLNETNETKIFVEGHHYDDYESGRTGFSVNEFTLVDAYQRIIDCLRQCARSDKRYGRVTNLHFWHITKVTDLDVAETCIEDCFLGTKEQYEKHQREQRREKLESAAKELAAKFQVKLSSMDFIEKLHDAINCVEYQHDEWNNPERRMEEWAACQYSGGGSEVYFDDLNFENSRFSSRMDEYYDILEWLEEECPLLMCKYQELKLSKE